MVFYINYASTMKHFQLYVLGGPGQLPHLAPTYAAVCAIAIAAVYYPQAYDAVDRYSN